MHFECRDARWLMSDVKRGGVQLLGRAGDMAESGGTGAAAEKMCGAHDCEIRTTLALGLARLSVVEVGLGQREWEVTRPRAAA